VKAYRVETWAVGNGDWCARVDFAFPGLGNTGPAEAIKHNGLRAAKRELRRRVDGAVRYEIIANKIDPLNRLHSLTVITKREGENNAPVQP